MQEVLKGMGCAGEIQDGNSQLGSSRVNKYEKAPGLLGSALRLPGSSRVQIQLRHGDIYVQKLTQMCFIRITYGINTAETRLLLNTKTPTAKKKFT